MVILDRSVPTPLYHQVRTLILREIEAGQWKPDDKLPTEDDLGVRFQVSKATIRQALRELVNLGYIRREQGRGTFVQRPPLQQGPRELTSFSDEMRRRGLVASSRILEHGPVPATTELADILGLDLEEPVYRLRRLRLADGEPMGLQTTYIPLVLVPGIAGQAFEGTSLYDLLRDHYNLYPSRARETHFAVSVSGDDALLLRVPPGSAGLAAERVAHLADGRPLEYVQSIMRGDRYRIVLDLVKPQIGR